MQAYFKELTPPRNVNTALQTEKFGERCTSCYYFLIDSDKIFATRLLREILQRPVTIFKIMTCSFIGTTTR